jgi:hypothetical protein
MRRPLAWFLGALAAVLLRRRRRAASVPAEQVAEPDPRAEELRQRLAESRQLVDERDEFEAAETPIDQAEVTSDPESRRRAVHEAGRAAAERMREG